MNRRLAHRPRHHLLRVQPRPLSRSHQDYLRQRWTYRQQNFLSTRRHPQGHSLTFVPWGWRLIRDAVKLRA